MKKIIIPLLMVLMTAVAFGQLAEVTSTFIGNHTFPDEGDAQGVSDGVDLYLFGGDNDPNEMRKYDVSEGTFTSLTTSVPINLYGSSGGGDCFYYNSKFYCFGRIPVSNIWTAMSINTDGSSPTLLANLSFIAFGQCALRPNSDEVYCFDFTRTSSDGVYKYDIGLDEWEKVTQIDHPSGVYLASQEKCLFRTDDEVWCVGGYPSGVFGSDAIVVYDVVTNTSDTTRTMPVKMAQHECKWFDNVIYCWSGYYTDDPSEMNTDVYYYDATTETNGTISDVIADVTSYMGCAEIDSNTNICLGGYDFEWEYYMGVFSVDFVSVSEGYEPMHGISDVTGLVIDFGVEFGIQAIALAGLIALVGIAVWVRGKF